MSWKGTIESGEVRITFVFRLEIGNLDFHTRSFILSSVQGCLSIRLSTQQMQWWMKRLQFILIVILHPHIFRDVMILELTLSCLFQIVFIEGRPSDEVLIDTRLVFYTVYNYAAFLAILLAILLAICVHYTRKSVVGSNKVNKKVDPRKYVHFRSHHFPGAM